MVTSGEREYSRLKVRRRSISHFKALQDSTTMALDPKGAALALHRFGFGPRAASIAALAPDPRAAVLAELERPNAGQIVNANLRSSARSQPGGLRIQCRAARAAASRTQCAREAAASAPAKRQAMENERADPAAGRPARAHRLSRARCRCRGRISSTEAQARFLAAHQCRDRLRRAAGVVLVEPFLRQCRRDRDGRRL